MGLESLLAKLEGRAVTPVTSAIIIDVTPKPAPMLACTPVTSVTAANDDAGSNAGVAGIPSQLLGDQASELRRAKVLAMLADPCIRYAVAVSDPGSDPVIVAVGIQGRATLELEIPASCYNPAALLELLEKHSVQAPVCPALSIDGRAP